MQFFSEMRQWQMNFFYQTNLSDVISVVVFEKKCIDTHAHLIIIYLIK